MSSRQKSSTQSSDLPPKRQGKAIRHDVSKPLQHVSLSRVVYLLAFFAAIFTAFYAYRITQWKGEAGGWWNLLMGKRPPHLNAQNTGSYANGGGVPRATGGDVALENHIDAIASILGMQPNDVASALSNAVHQHVAPKSVSSLSSSISSSASAAGSTATNANILFDQSGHAGDTGAKEEGVADTAATVAKAVEAIAGLDDTVMFD